MNSVPDLVPALVLGLITIAATWQPTSAALAGVAGVAPGERETGAALYGRFEATEYAARYAAGTNLVALAPEVAAVFPDSEAVNEALRTLIRIGRAHRVRLHA